MRFKLIGFLIGLLLAALAGTPTDTIGFAQDCTIIVKSGQSIQAAIDQSPPNSVVCLEAGKWNEALTISKSLTIKGAARDLTLLDGKGVGKDSITIRATGLFKVTLIGITVQNYCEHTGLFVSETVNVTFFNSKIANNARGIVVAGSATVSLENAQIYDHKAQALKISDSASVSVSNSYIVNNNRCCERAAIEANDRASLNLTNSTISGNRLEGIRVRHNAKAQITNVTISENNRNVSSASLFVTDSAQADIKDSHFTDNRSFGISIQGAAQVLIENSYISNNQQGGIVIGDHAQVTVQSSQISNNRKLLDHGDGLSLWGTARVHLLKNTISDNDGHGLQTTDRTIIDKCQDNIIINNHKGDFEPADLSFECHWSLRSQAKEKGVVEQT